MYFIGVDPGKKGAIAILDASGSICGIHDFPMCGGTYDEDALCDIVFAIPKPWVAVIEWPFAKGNQSSTNTATQFDGVGLVRGVLKAVSRAREEGSGCPDSANNCRVLKVAPQAWQKVVYAGLPRCADPKDMSVRTAHAMFPSAELFGPKGGAKDGRADALLIAEYARRTYGS